MEGEIIQASIRDADNIVSLVSRYDKDFEPPLSERIDLNSYVHKLLDRGYCHVYKHKEKIRGVVAYYANDTDSLSAYLSLILVDEEYRGSEVASKMLNVMEKHCRNIGFNKINLEMASNKNDLLKWYMRQSYMPQEEYNRDGSRCVKMSKSL